MLSCLMLLDVADRETIWLVRRYLAVLNLPDDRLRITTRKPTFEAWLGRRISSSVGGAYVFLRAQAEHAVLIHLPRINRTRPKSLEIVVAEELLHYRDALDGDHRRHHKHGYDRIAARVAALTGASLTEVRAALVPPARRPLRYVYECAACRRQVHRRIRGTWSCGGCSSRFDRRFVLRLVGETQPGQATAIRTA